MDMLVEPLGMQHTMAPVEDKVLENKVEDDLGDHHFPSDINHLISSFELGESYFKARYHGTRMAVEG